MTKGVEAESEFSKPSLKGVDRKKLTLMISIDFTLWAVRNLAPAWTGSFITGSFEGKNWPMWISPEFWELWKPSHTSQVQTGLGFVLTNFFLKVVSPEFGP